MWTPASSVAHNVRNADAAIPAASVNNANSVRPSALTANAAPNDRNADAAIPAASVSSANNVRPSALTANAAPNDRNADAAIPAASVSSVNNVRPSALTVNAAPNDMNADVMIAGLTVVRTVAMTAEPIAGLTGKTPIVMVAATNVAQIVEEMIAAQTVGVITGVRIIAGRIAAIVTAVRAGIIVQAAIPIRPITAAVITDTATDREAAMGIIVRFTTSSTTTQATIR